MLAVHSTVFLLNKLTNNSSQYEKFSVRSSWGWWVSLKFPLSSLLTQHSSVGFCNFISKMGRHLGISGFKHVFLCKVGDGQWVVVILGFVSSVISFLVCIMYVYCRLIVLGFDRPSQASAPTLFETGVLFPCFNKTLAAVVFWLLCWYVGFFWYWFPQISYIFKRNKLCFFWKNKKQKWLALIIYANLSLCLFGCSLLILSRIMLTLYYVVKG